MIIIDHILEVESYIDQVDAVIFDLDDTLYSEKEYVRSGYRKISNFFHKPEMEAELWSAFESGQKAIDVVFQKYQMVDKKSEALKVYRFQKPDIHLYPGVSEMLQRIRRNKRIGIITDGRPEGQRAKLESLNLNLIVDEMIITDELGGIEYRKPNEKAFLLMSKKLNAPLEKCVYIGDNIAKDFIAPKRLNMQCVWFRNPEGIYSKNSDKSELYCGT